MHGTRGMKNKTKKGERKRNKKKRKERGKELETKNPVPIPAKELNKGARLALDRRMGRNQPPFSGHSGSRSQTQTTMFCMHAEGLLVLHFPLSVMTPPVNWLTGGV